MIQKIKRDGKSGELKFKQVLGNFTLKFGRLTLFYSVITGCYQYICFRKKPRAMILKAKRQVLVLAAFWMWAFFTPLAAQQKSLQDSTPEQRAKMQTEWMKTKLELNSSQAAQAYNLNLLYAQKNESVLKSSEGKLAKFKKLRPIQKEKDLALSKILNPDQYRKYQDLKDQLIQNLKDKKR